MIKTKNLIICVLSVIILVLCSYIVQIHMAQPTLLTLWKPCVPDEETAIEIAQIVFKVYTGFEIDKNDFAVLYDEEQWHVHLKNKEDFGEPVITNDDSGVTINKQDGTITRVVATERMVEDYFKLKAMYE